MKKILFLLLFLISISANGATYYVATTGNDARTKAQARVITTPWATWRTGIDSLSTGDTLYIRGGTYTPAGTSWSGVYVGARRQNPVPDGTAANPICVFAYPGETPILKGTSITQATPHYGLMLSYCDYWHLKGLTVEYIVQNGTDWAQGIALWDCTNIIVEECVTRHIAGVGMGWANEPSTCDKITFLNCDSWAVEDSHASDSDADCFGIENTLAGSEVILDGCRAWFASDDCFDFWESEGNIIVKDCWAWGAGYSYTTGLPTAHGGVGFKLGMTTGASTFIFLRTLQNCLAFENAGHGIAQNLALVRIKLLNNTIFKNGVYGIQINEGQYAHEIKNNISHNTGATNYGGTLGDELINADVATNGNGWESAATITNADFQSVDTTGVSGARVAGELPTLTFLHLAGSSDAIDVGTVVSEIVYYGSAPDIGAFETGAVPPYWNPTGIGWLPVMYNANFRGEVNFTKPFKIQGVPIDVTGSELSILAGLTATAAELNKLHGATVTTTEINHLSGVTSNLQTQLDTKADTVNQSFTGTTVISKLNIGSATSATKAEFDSCVVYNNHIYCFIGGDTVGFGTLAAGRVDISTVAIMLDDTLRSSGKHILYTQWQVDSLLAGFSGGTDFSRLAFIVDTTAGAPETGDSILINTAFINKHIEVYRGAGGGTLYKQYRKNVGQLYHNGYSFQKATGTIVFTPHFETSNHVIIEATDSTSWTNIILPGYGEEMITDGTFTVGTAWAVTAGWTIGGGLATYDDAHNGVDVRQTNANMVSAITINTDYKLEFDIDIVSGDASIAISNSAWGALYVAKSDYADGHQIVYFTTPADILGGGIAFFAYDATSDAAFTIDNISLKEDY